MWNCVLSLCPGQEWTPCLGRWPWLRPPTHTWKSVRTESSSTSKHPPVCAPPRSTSTSVKSSTRRRWMDESARWRGVVKFDSLVYLCEFHVCSLIHHHANLIRSWNMYCVYCCQRFPFSLHNIKRDLRIWWFIPAHLCHLAKGEAPITKMLFNFYDYYKIVDWDHK